MAGLVPSLLLALFGAWCGTFAWGPLSLASAAAAVSLLGTLFWSGPAWQDPLRLGTAGRLLPLALWIAMAASAWASPVSRAGWAAVLLFPAFCGLPGAVERCWRREADRRWGLRALALTVAGVSLWALADWMLLGTPRPSMPLGHHNLLAAWLLILLPLAVLPTREPGPWRLAGLAAGALAVYAVLASRSLTGFAALAVEALVGFGGRARPRQRRWWAVLLALALLVSFLQIPRVLRIASGEDPSARARASYWAAGWAGFRARPMLGWGPGAAAWTAAAFLDPIPRVNPWGESVGELHSLPLQLGYELGFTGLLLALGLTVLFFARRIAEREEGRDPALLAGGLLGLGGGAIASLGSGAIAVTALPLAAAVAAGAALSGSGRGRGRQASRLPVRIYAVLALLALLPLELARWHYDRAALADAAGRSREAEAELESAMRLDPAFPLYRMRLALLRGRTSSGRGGASELALRAAEAGGAVPALWLTAGVLGYSAQRSWAGSTLETACALDPLDPFPPYYEMLVNPTDGDAPAHGAHALLAEPRLAAAIFWERHPGLLQRILVLVRAWPEVDAGWKEALLAAVPPSAGPQGPSSPVELTIDLERGQTLSLPIFRRRPWPTRWGLIPVRKNAWEGLRLPPAAASKGTSWRFLHAAPCLRRRSLRGHALLTQ
jgi:O-antigen ligase